MQRVTLNHIHLNLSYLFFICSVGTMSAFPGMEQYLWLVIVGAFAAFAFGWGTGKTSDGLKNRLVCLVMKGKHRCKCTDMSSGHGL